MSCLALTSDGKYACVNLCDIPLYSLYILDLSNSMSTKTIVKIEQRSLMSILSALVHVRGHAEGHGGRLQPLCVCVTPLPAFTLRLEVRRHPAAVSRAAIIQSVVQFHDMIYGPYWP